MWIITVLAMAIAVSLEPFRIGMTVLMLNRPRRMLQLLAFLCGGFAMGMTVGLVVLVVLRPELSGSTHFTLPKVQIAIGVLLVLAAVVMATKASPRRFGGQRRAGAPVGRLAARIRHLLDAPSLWIAGAAGLGIALPSVDYLAALAVILASGATLATQVGGLVMFNVVAFTFVEIPLLAYLAAPAKTQRSVAAVQGWIRSGHRRAALLAAVGCVLLAVGIASL